jgi:hypothetical protein
MHLDCRFNGMVSHSTKIASIHTIVLSLKSQYSRNSLDVPIVDHECRNSIGDYSTNLQTVRHGGVADGVTGVCSLCADKMESSTWAVQPVSSPILHVVCLGVISLRTCLSVAMRSAGCICALEQMS